MTFDQCREGYIDAHGHGWAPSYHSQWKRSLETYASPRLGKLPPEAIDTPLVMEIFKPIWTKMPVLAPLVLQRCESIWSWAKASKLCVGENPFAWDRLKHLLASPTKIHTVKHHEAMPYKDVPVFIAELRAKCDGSARALEFLILTAARTSEVTGARWIEIEGNVWTVPAKRMKGRIEHRVPLSMSAMRIIDRQRQVRENDFVFPGMKRHGLSRATMDNPLSRMGVDVTVHGFRSSFRDWAADCTHFPNHVVEMALAHKVGSAVEAAYRRGDLLEKRRELMAAWAAYVAPDDPGA